MAELSSDINLDRTAEIYLLMCVEVILSNIEVYRLSILAPSLRIRTLFENT
jgi:hypothetical protein